MAHLTTDQLVEAWRTNCRINTRLMDAISDAGMAATLSTRGGRGVGGQFAHLHNVRVWHLERRAKALLGDLATIPAGDPLSRARLKAALLASGKAIEQLLAGAAEGTPGIKGFKRGPIQTLAYLVAHESHHRGSILLTLKQCGHPVDKLVRYGIWDWDRI